MGFLGLPASGAYSTLVLALPGLVWAYRKNSSRTVALYAPLLAWWVILQPFAWRFQADPVYFVGLVGGLFLLVAECHAAENTLAIPYRFYGSLLTVGALIPLSYYSYQQHLHLDESPTGMLIETALAVVLALGVTLAMAEYDRRASGRPISLAQAVLGENRRRWLPIGIILFLTLLVYWNLLVGESLVPTVLANAAMVVLALWLIQVGLRADRGIPFSAGVLLFLLWAVLRYIDLFGDFGGMLGASLMFFLCGTTLFGVAQYGVGERLWVMSELLDDSGIDPVGPAKWHAPESWLGRLDHALAWFRARERWVFLAAVVFQILVLTGMIAGKAISQRSGDLILLRVVPVDPRDLFRGDYVILGYEISRIPPRGIDGLPAARRWDNAPDWQGRTVYVSLVPESDGQHYGGGAVSTVPPAPGVRFIAGTVVDPFRITFGIESYFVQEGNGKKYEDAIRNHRLSAEVALTSRGHALLRGLRID